MATYRKRGNQWQVIWKEPIALVQPDGSTLRKWQQQARSVPTEALAKQLMARIEASAAVGERWRDARKDLVATLRTIALAYVRAAIDANVPLPTQRFRSAMMGAFLDFLNAREENSPGANLPANALTLTFLERYAQSLPGDGRKAQTRYRKVMAVERMWTWAFERPERFPGVPTPRRYTGSPSESDKLSQPPPVVAIAAPVWREVDAMIEQLLIPWHRQVATLMRFTGLRASQACGLEWRDVDLERGILAVRARVRGAKRSRARVIPLHPSLVVQMLEWGPREGLLFPRRYKDANGQSRSGPYQGDALVEPFRRAWRKAGVGAEKWDIPADDSQSLSAGVERAKGSPTHAIRRCIRTGLIRAGVEEAIVLYLVGQTQGITAAAYVPESTPEQSPYWPRLLEAVGKIPGMESSDGGR